MKAGMIYGRGDHMLDHLSHSLHTLPLFLTVGIGERPIRPLAIDDLLTAARAAVIEGRMARQTVAITGAEQLRLGEAARRVARVLGRPIVLVPAPVWLQHVLARLFERIMRVPLVAVAQVRILSEGVVEPAPPCDPLPADLAPRRPFSPEQIRAGLPEPGPFRLRDVRCCA